MPRRFVKHSENFNLHFPLHLFNHTEIKTIILKNKKKETCFLKRFLINNMNHYTN